MFAVRKNLRTVLRLGGRQLFSVRKDNFLSGENAAYADEMYAIWKKDPKSVHASWQVYFGNVEKGLDPKSAYVEPPFDGLPPLSAREQPKVASKQETVVETKTKPTVADRAASLLGGAKQQAG